MPGTETVEKPTETTEQKTEVETLKEKAAEGNYYYVIDITL